MGNARKIFGRKNAEIAKLRKRVALMRTSIECRNDLLRIERAKCEAYIARIKRNETAMSEMTTDKSFMRAAILDLQTQIENRDGRIIGLKSDVDDWRNAFYNEREYSTNLKSEHVREIERRQRAEIEHNNERNARIQITRDMTLVAKFSNRQATEITELRERISILQYVQDDMQNIINFHKSETARVRGWLNHEKQETREAVEAMNHYIAENRKHVAECERLASRMETEILAHAATKIELENANAEIERLKSEIEHATIAGIEDIETCAPVIIDFANFPDIIGVAPCGNGCPVKRDASGRHYDAHEITCEEHEEYHTGNIEI